MKNLLLIILFLVSGIFAKANKSVLQDLYIVNAEWKNNPDGKKLAEQIESTSACTFNDQITLHLKLVESTLRLRSMSHLTGLQKQNRIALLDQLNNYWHNGLYPVNDYLPFK